MKVVGLGILGALLIAVAPFTFALGIKPLTALLFLVGAMLAVLPLVKEP